MEFDSGVGPTCFLLLLMILLLMLLLLITETFLQSFVEIGFVVVIVVVDPRNLPFKFGRSVTAEILLTLSLCEWWSKVIFVSNPTFE